MPPFAFDPLILITDLVFTVISVVFCFLIYFKTKEIYELTKHSGIMYFRDAFLFFGWSYVLRFLLSIFLIYRVAFDVILPRALFIPIFILPLSYLSTIGIFYLIFSSLWKKFDNKKMLVLGHGIAILLSIISFATRSHKMLIYLQCALLVIAVVLRFTAQGESKKISKVKILYFLVAVLWLINLLVIDRKKPFSLEVEIFFHLLSLFVFSIIYFKISKWIR